MDFGQLINALPLWLLFVLTLGLSLSAVAVGTWLAGIALRHETKEPEAPLGSLVSAVLGLLAFILAFTFGMTGARLDARRALVLEESNAVGTTYLRAGLLPQHQRLEVRRLLREYVDIRLKAQLSNFAETLALSEKLHGQLWSQAESLVAEEMDSELRMLFITSLNEVIDLHESRKTLATLNRIPGPMWLSVYLLSILTMVTIGYQVGMSGSRWLRGMPVLAAAFSLVIVMIADIDRPGEGNISVSQQPLADVRQMMSQDAP
jgi:hypothetical protein